MLILKETMRENVRDASYTLYACRHHAASACTAAHNRLRIVIASRKSDESKRFTECDFILFVSVYRAATD